MNPLPEERQNVPMPVGYNPADMKTTASFTDGAGSLPYGVDELDPSRVQIVRGLARCPVRGCFHSLVPPTRKGGTGDVCPDHGIRVHSSSTYSYADYRRNLIVDADYFHQRIHRNPFKWETNRFGQERSEDAVSWNVFRSLQRHGLLHQVVRLATGIEEQREPKLLLWGLELSERSVEPWDLLIAGRERFESDLPVARPKTEPDIALFLPGKYLILIEAKFCSPNGVYERDTKTKLLDLTLGQLIQIYHDDSLRFLDYDIARKRDRIHYQLWRNLIFAQFMAQQDGPSTQAFHINLVRQVHEDDSCEAMLTMMRPEYHDRFNRITWEDIYQLLIPHQPKVNRLCRYLSNKSERFQPAFQIPHTP